MRSVTLTVLATLLLVLGACAPAYEDGHLSRNINRQREARDACLSTHVESLDDHTSRPDSIGRAVSNACASENDKLIQLMSTMDRSGEVEITEAVRKDAVVKATSYVLSSRSFPGK